MRLHGLFLALLAGAGAHVWFPPHALDNVTHARELTTAGCTSPGWSTGPADAATFQSYHLHIAWAAGNTAQVAAVAAFKDYLISVAGADASCGSLSDTAAYFCYSQTINSFTASSKQDPFYNVRPPPPPPPRRLAAAPSHRPSTRPSLFSPQQDMFIFVGAKYLKAAVSFA